MSEKRFKMEIPINNGNHPLLKDNETGEIVEIVNVEMLIKKMNEQQNIINILLNLLYQAEEIIIYEYSTNIREDIGDLNKTFEEKDIKKIERFVVGSV